MGGFFGPTGGKNTSTSSGGGFGSAINFTSPPGTIDPTVTGFSTTVGRIRLTLSADTAWEGLPAGTDGQQLAITIVAGAFAFTVLHLNGATAQKQILASGDFVFTLGDTLQLLYDTTLTQWLLFV